VLTEDAVLAKEALIVKLEVVAKLALPNKDPVNDPVYDPVNEAPIYLEPENILEVTALVTNRELRLASEPEVMTFFQDGI
jgi:hypothetical protein